MRLLIVEDEVELAEALARGLRREGYAVDVALCGLEAMARLTVSPYDLVCLDLGLPDLDGRELCKRLRSEPPFPDEPPRVLVLTARDALEERIGGLDDGADDYLVKPVAFAELSARVRALLRRRSGGSAVLRVGDLELDEARHVARRAGEPLELSPKELSLLRYLMAHAEEVHSAERLLAHVWDENADPFTNTVRVTIATLRRKLAGSGLPQPIETVIGRGYRLKAET